MLTLSTSAVVASVAGLGVNTPLTPVGAPSSAMVALPVSPPPRVSVRVMAADEVFCTTLTLPGLLATLSVGTGGGAVTTSRWR